MSWNYRIVRYRNNNGYGLHEVYYDNEGQPWGMTKNPASFSCDTREGPEGIIGPLLTARVDAKRRPILDEPKKWPGKNPSDQIKNFKIGAPAAKARG